jgi:hypothetical protein
MTHETYTPLLAHPITRELHLIRLFNQKEKQYYRQKNRLNTWPLATELLAIAKELTAIDPENYYFVEDAEMILASEDPEAGS